MTVNHSTENVTESDADVAARRLAAAFDPAVIDRLIADAEAAGTPIDGADGLLN